jgi:hypothetical protein
LDRLSLGAGDQELLPRKGTRFVRKYIERTIRKLAFDDGKSGWCSAIPRHSLQTIKPLAQVIDKTGAWSLAHHDATERHRNLALAVAFQIPVALEPAQSTRRAEPGDGAGKVEGSLRDRATQLSTAFGKRGCNVI